MSDTQQFERPAKASKTRDFIAKQWAGLSFFKLAIARCLIYGGIVSWGMFNSGVEGYASLSDMSTLQLIKLFGNMFFTGFCGVLVAFLDQTLQRLGTQPPKSEPPSTETK